MYKIHTSTKFRRDIRRCKRQHKNMQLFKDINALLVAGKPLPLKNNDHILTGNWYGHRECHIEPDWLLIYKVYKNEKSSNMPVLDHIRNFLDKRKI